MAAPKKGGHLTAAQLAAYRRVWAKLLAPPTPEELAAIAAEENDPPARQEAR
jgi:hypothetical protein